MKIDAVLKGTYEPSWPDTEAWPSDWTVDIYNMHTKFKVHEAVNQMDKEQLKEFLKFRVNFIHEEYKELEYNTEFLNLEEIVDALIDICVVAIGTLDAFKIDSHRAWQEVLKANMAKEPGVKSERPNPLGLPDLIKPKGWTGPSHEGNYGLLSKLLEEE